MQRKQQEENDLATTGIDPFALLFFCDRTVKTATH